MNALVVHNKRVLNVYLAPVVTADIKRRGERSLDMDEARPSHGIIKIIVPHSYLLPKVIGTIVVPDAAVHCLVGLKRSVAPPLLFKRTIEEISNVRRHPITASLVALEPQMARTINDLFFFFRC